LIRKLVSATAFIGFIGFASPALAFECPVHFAKAESAIASATKAMGAMSNKTAAGLVHTLIDDAKMILASSRHNHAKPAAGGYDHARSIAKAKSALGYAEAAIALAGR
jgi:hypothetical protein